MNLKLAVPTIHRNGSSQDSLLDAVTDASDALYKAMRVMEKTHPNGRDYYPQGPSAIRQAEAQYQDRMKRVKAVRQELADLAEAIADGGHGVTEDSNMDQFNSLLEDVRSRAGLEEAKPSVHAGKRALGLVKPGEWNIILSKTGSREWTAMVRNPDGGGSTEKAKTEDGLMWLLQRRVDLRGADKVWLIRAKFGSQDGETDHWATDAFWHRPEKPWPIR